MAKLDRSTSMEVSNGMELCCGYMSKKHCGRASCAQQTLIGTTPTRVAPVDMWCFCCNRVLVYGPVCGVLS